MFLYQLLIDWTQPNLMINLPKLVFQDQTLRPFCGASMKGIGWSFSPYSFSFFKKKR